MAKTAKKRQKVQMPAGIRSKMMAAVSMLMVSVIMMVSSTYAWFTLSTAPEVTGITTNVGANGNLEMMLLNSASYSSSAEDLGVVSKVGDSSAKQDVKKANETWGNLVDLTSSSYGLNSIALLPSRLNVNSNTVQGTPLLAPSYGTDGRVAQINTATYPGTYSAGAWTYSETAAGVRAIGTSSGATVRTTAYRSAMSQASSSMNAAKETATTSLQDNAQPLATLLMAQVQGQSTGFSTSYLTNLKSIIDGVTIANNYIETSIRNAVLAYGLSAANTKDLSDEDVAVITQEVEDASLEQLTSLTNVTLSTEMVAAITNAVNTYNDTKSNLSDAQSAYKTIVDANPTSLSWDEINGVLKYLVVKENMTVNGYEAKAENKDQIIKDAIPEGGTLSDLVVSIVMHEGSGVYYNVAEVCDTYLVRTTVQVEYGVTVPVNATMTQELPEGTAASMVSAISIVKTAGIPTTSVSGSATVTLSETYGYMLDFGFRTNAADSSLLLQTDPAQRVYGSSAEEPSIAEGTQGAGSYMQFTSTNINTFSISEVRALMSAIRVVFVQPDVTNGNYKMLAVGALDITQNDDGTYSGGKLSKTIADDDTLKVNLVLREYEVNASTGKLTLGNKLDTQKIIDLTQNIASKISVIVYLDGDIVDNTMVANATQSMYGSLNLQFSSTATLVPMKNSGMLSGGIANVPEDVVLTAIAGEGTDTTEYTIGNYKGTVKPGCIIYSGTDDEIYYSTDGGTTKYLLTTSNYMNVLDVSTESGGTTTVAVTGIELDKTTATLTLIEGQTVTETLTATVTPDNATDKTVTWKSSNETVATVYDGIVTALKAGTTTITATAGEQSATCEITVN